MDLNQLYFDHQRSSMDAAQAYTHALRRDGELGASLIAGRIGCMQRTLGADAASGWELMALPARADLSGHYHGVYAPSLEASHD